MKKIYIAILAVCVLGAIPSQTSAIEVVELKQQNSNKVIVRFMFRNGSVVDPKGKEGLTALTASLVAEGGTAHLTKTEISELIYPMAASYSASVDKEVSTFTFQVHNHHLDAFYPVMKGIILTPSFTEADFNRVKSVQLNAITRGVRQSSDENYSKFALEDFLYRGTAYQHMVNGTVEGLGNITLDDVKEHYTRYFSQENLMLGIAGNYPQTFFNTLKNDLQSLPRENAVIPEIEQAAMPNGVEVEIISKPGALGSAIYMGFPLEVNRSDNESYPALLLAASYLGEHRKSYGRLFKQIREVRSMNYGSYSYVEWYPNGSRNMLPPSGFPRTNAYFSMWIRPVQTAAALKSSNPEMKNLKIGHAHFALRMAFYELNKLIEEGIPQENFEVNQQFLRSYMKIYVQKPVEQLGYLMDSRFFGRENFIQEMDRQLASLRKAQVDQAIKQHFQVNNMKITIVTDPAEARALAESLRQNSVSPMVYTKMVKEGLPQEVFAEDDVVKNFKLNITKVTVVNTDDTFVMNR